MNRQYSNPETQEAIEGIHKSIAGFDSVIEAMNKTLNMSRRESDKSRPTELTQSQQDTIAKNQGIHIYGSSHPLYTESK